jgi:ATP-dependent 26S proteasome regulatory subunit
MLEIVNQLDGFEARGNVKVLMATNRCVRPKRKAQRAARNPQRAACNKPRAA